jgi:cytochrome c oxidase cbb3-type subunit 4
MHTFITNFIVMFWTPIFFLIFLSVLAYALWPSNHDKFDDAARMPLRED